MTLSKDTLCIECHYALIECRISFIVMLNVVMLNVVAPFKLVDVLVDVLDFQNEHRCRGYTLTCTN